MNGKVRARRPGMPDPRLAEQFRKLCEQAAKETDSEKLLELTKQINWIFDEREKAKQSGHQHSGGMGAFGSCSDKERLGP
jgi:hypothetical protein